MDAQTLLPRLEKAEAEIIGLKADVAELHRSLEAAREAPPAKAAVRPAEVFCANCQGGNPPDAIMCIWCGRPVTARVLPTTQREAARPAMPPKPPSPVRQHVTPADLAFPELAGSPGAVKAEPASQAASVQTEPVEVAAASTSTPRPARTVNLDFKRAEFWLNKLGIALLLLGVAFLFKYSIDRGWLTPWVRVAFGMGLGTVLLGFGYWFRKERAHFSAVLFGGGIATYYITGFAAYELLDLVSYEVAFGYMAAVTALALGLGVWRDETALSLVGLAGGLATPFVLYSGQNNFPGLVMYTSALLTFAALIYLAKGWRTVLASSVVGGLFVIQLGYQSTFGWPSEPSLADRWALQGAAAFILAAFWVLPVLREWLERRTPERWARPATPATDLGRLSEKLVDLLVLALPAAALGMTRLAWTGEQLDPHAMGWVSMGLAALLGLMAWGLRPALKELSYTHTVMAVVVATLGIATILEGNALLIALALEVVALHRVAKVYGDDFASLFANLIAAPVSIWLAVRIANYGASDGFLFNASVASDLAVIALLVVTSFVGRFRRLAPAYRAVAFLAMAGWLLAELWSLPSGTGWVMLAWLGLAVVPVVVESRLPGVLAKNEAVMFALWVTAAATLPFAQRVYEGSEGTYALLNGKTLVDMAAIAAVVALSLLAREKEAKGLFRTLAHAAAVALLWRELVAVDSSGIYVMLAWAAYGLFMIALGRYAGDKLSGRIAPLAFAGAAYYFAYFVYGAITPGAGVLDAAALCGAAVIAAAVGASFLTDDPRVLAGFRLAAHIGLLAWLWRELYPLQDGNAFATGAWALYAVLVIAEGARENRNIGVIITGLATLFLVVAKLFLVDLVAVDPLLRVMLFLGVGGIFLVISYYFQNIVRKGPGPEHRAHA